MGFLRRLPNKEPTFPDRELAQAHVREEPRTAGARQADALGLVARVLAKAHSGTRRKPVASGPTGERPRSSPAGLVISFPKSGKTWLSYLYVFYAAHHLLTPDEAQAFVDRFLADGFSYNPQTEDRFLQILNRPENRHPRLPAVRFAHSFPTAGDVPYYRAAVSLQKLAVSKRALYLIRDPRDVLVSYFHHVKTKGKVPLAADADISEFVRSECLGIRAVVNYMNQVCQQGPSVFEHFEMLYFEDLVMDPIPVLTTALEALGIEDVREDAVAAAVNCSEFRTLQTVDRENRLKHGKDASQAALRFRQGKIGSFRHELQPADIAFVNRVIDEHLDPLIARYRSSEASKPNPAY